MENYMIDTVLDECLKEYLEAQRVEEEIKEKKESLKAKILEKMGDKTEYTNKELGSIKLSKAELIKYKDEVSLIKLLKENGYERFVKEKIDTTSFNKYVKDNSSSGTPLMESINSNLVKTTTDKLTVKGVN